MQPDQSGRNRVVYRIKKEWALIVISALSAKRARTNERRAPAGWILLGQSPALVCWRSETADGDEHWREGCYVVPFLPEVRFPGTESCARGCRHNGASDTPHEDTNEVTQA